MQSKINCEAMEDLQDDMLDMMPIQDYEKETFGCAMDDNDDLEDELDALEADACMEDMIPV